MKSITINAAAMLMERAEELEEMDHHGWRCIYLQLHDKEERYNATLRVNFINRAVVDLLARDEGYIYFCDDGDIVILFEGALKPLATRLAGHFGDLNPERLGGQVNDSLFRFLDLSKQWAEFMYLCQERAARVTPTNQRMQRLYLQQRANRASA